MSKVSSLRTIKTSEPIACIVVALTEAIKTMSLDEYEPYELVEHAMEVELLELDEDGDFLRCVDIAQDLIQLSLFAEDISSAANCLTNVHRTLTGL
jgi:hypothetical protein